MVGPRPRVLLTLPLTLNIENLLRSTTVYNVLIFGQLDK